KFVCIFDQFFQVADTKMARTGLKNVAEGERTERGVAARAAARDHKAIAIYDALNCQVLCTVGAIINVHDAPLTRQTLAVGSSVACTPTIVYIEYSDPAACPILNGQSEHTAGGGRWPAVAQDQQRRKFSLWRYIIAIAWGIEEGMGRQPLLGRKLDWL